MEKRGAQISVFFARRSLGRLLCCGLGLAFCAESIRSRLCAYWFELCTGKAAVISCGSRYGDGFTCSHAVAFSDAIDIAAADQEILTAQKYSAMNR